MQELGIPCRCTGHEPLKILIKNANSATQVWSVAKHIAMHRHELVQWLENCWVSH
ncbi:MULTISPECIES: Asr1405/Asl0597 family protein [Leptolyngbya]|uniref:Asr1405/Asl0597 family protein n=1 Tax=Leptolyngbya TaxID=47251 RepID=UPI00322014B5